MRSLPPPRITRKRRWRRIKRALKSLFTKGYILDPGAFLSGEKGGNNSISKIRQSRVTSRVRKAKSRPTDLGLREGANAGIRTATFIGRVAKRASMPILRPFNSRSLLNVSLRF
ncbi:hypothetical protein HYPBUDRAFT_174239 [Hyphopichia burtonii NRRL Y-1933]|uniref:Uncharacterized protein n=1 Tax=Hyphopichia burtonii NRRL Y-1933 TaxID=984485 RepID=A0A1E4RR98_9ASCO|nr:hypothetical protein HYPBUDRAFT_174239 [Hyphopichia burtonii NRRL Y-1933]ODV69782.1 hypothetical protein HYPBUDRAFT_174239 [Hyphopichia burtonii NRRL Y-1933]